MKMGGVTQPIAFQVGMVYTVLRYVLGWAFSTSSSFALSLAICLATTMMASQSFSTVSLERNATVGEEKPTDQPLQQDFQDSPSASDVFPLSPDHLEHFI